MDAGQLKHRITIQKNTITKDANGYDVSNWQDYKTVWAAIETTGSRELFASMSEQRESSVIFTVRYDTYLDTVTADKYRISFRSKTYNIKPLINEGFANRFVKIAATEGINNG